MTALFTTADASMQQGRVKAFMVRGEVALLNNATGRETPLARGQEFTEGFTVVTGSESVCLLLFSNGASINLTPNSKLNVSEFVQEPYNMRLGSYATLQADPSTSSTRLRLDYGELVGEVKKLRESSAYRVDTPNAAAGIRGTTFVVNYDPIANITVVTNVGGDVFAEFRGDVFDVEDAESAVLQGDGTIEDTVSGDELIQRASETKLEDSAKALEKAMEAGENAQKAYDNAIEQGLSPEQAENVAQGVAEDTFGSDTPLTEDQINESINEGINEQQQGGDDEGDFDDTTGGTDVTDETDITSNTSVEGAE